MFEFFQSTSVSTPSAGSYHFDVFGMLRQLFVKASGDAKACGDVLSRSPAAKDPALIAAKLLVGIDPGIIVKSTPTYWDATRANALKRLYSVPTLSAIAKAPLIDAVLYVDRTQFASNRFQQQARVHAMIDPVVVTLPPLSFAASLTTFLGQQKFKSAKLGRDRVESVENMLYLSQVELAMPQEKANAHRVMFEIVECPSVITLHRAVLRLELFLSYYACRDEWRRQCYNANISPFQFEQHTVACGFVLPYDGVACLMLEQYIKENKNVFPLVYRAMAMRVLFMIEVPPVSVCSVLKHPAL